MRKNKIKRFIYRLLIVIGMGTPVIIMTIVVYSFIMPEGSPDLLNNEICKPQKIQTLIYFTYTIFFFVFGFVIFAFADSVCLWANLYDRAPTPDNVMFNNRDDRLFLGGGNNILADESNSHIRDNSRYTDISKRSNKVSMFENSRDFRNVTMDSNL